MTPAGGPSVWERPAALVAAWGEQAGTSDRELSAALDRLERALGIAALGDRDPSPGVTARRFGRCHAAATRTGREADPDLETVVQVVAGIAARMLARSRSAMPSDADRGDLVKAAARATVTGRVAWGPPAGSPRR